MTTESPTHSDSLADRVYVDDLTGEVCRTLLASHHVGRIAFVGSDGFPVVWPVNYTVDGDDVVVRTDRGEMYENVPLHRVAFEVDEFNDAVQTGWSLLIRGGARDVTDSIGEEARADPGRAPQVWAPGGKNRWIAIRIDTISGRQIVRRHAANG